MFLPQPNSPRLPLQKRDDDESDNEKRIPIIVVIALLVAIIVGLTIYYGLRTLRFRNAEPIFIPTQYLKNKWRNWLPKTVYGQVPDSLPATRQTRVNRREDTSYAGAGPDDAGIDRNTSVRSVMTLPMYSPIPKPEEQVIGREGERAGMDVVVEFPETADEEEARREEQMESLYQIRLARRAEIAERERRRQERREARERGDWARLEELRRESRARNRGDSLSPNGSNTNLSAATLIAEHQSRGRERRVASVTYGEVGHVRHDGTRLRASSHESDSSPLLDGASSMGTTGNHSTSSLSGRHQRATSGSSSVFSNGSNQSDTPRGSFTATEADIGDSNIPQPPQYDQLDWGEAPEYQSSVVERGRGPQLPPVIGVPSIEIEVPTPGNSAPVTPVSPIPRQS
ncbi:hypothetical protein AJ79_07066 [Helicocarpus griseus UAMH5409]|uniref:Uncharacterized protein n=1 Tax=Helicocarpus griseus UAMH5409 TaxID=1447875 RepID=A0A2B7X6N9_9EURO|nr:hypothetical protein AJ79_07066 [Helicocarpus griseus UAMH5409]